jgi:hypothetical protein
VAQNSLKTLFMKKRGEWQAYYENAFHEKYPKFLNSLNFTNAFANKALEYYNGRSTYANKI